MVGNLYLLTKSLRKSCVFSNVIKAIKAVGPSLDDAADFILEGTHRDNHGASSYSKCSIVNDQKALREKKALSSSRSSGRTRQSSIMEHLKSLGRSKRSRTNVESDGLVSGTGVLPKFT